MSAQDDDEIHQEILKEALTQEDQRPPAPKFLIGILALALITVMAVWVIPHHSLPIQAKAGDVPSLEDVMLNMDVPDREGSNKIYSYVLAQDSELKLIAARIVTKTCNEQDLNCYADALFYFVRDNIAYLSDPIDEYYEYPQETLLAGAADCDGQAILLASLMRHVGIQTRFAYQPRHVYVEALLPDTSLFAGQYDRIWKAYDTTCSHCGPGELGRPN